MAGFGFIEFDDARVRSSLLYLVIPAQEIVAGQDAEDAVRDCNGKDFMGDRLLVEFAKSPRSFDGPPRDRNDRGPSVSYLFIR